MKKAKDDERRVRARRVMGMRKVLEWIRYRECGDLEVRSEGTEGIGDGRDEKIKWSV